MWGFLATDIRLLLKCNHFFRDRSGRFETAGIFQKWVIYLDSFQTVVVGQVVNDGSGKYVVLGIFQKSLIWIFFPPPFPVKVKYHSVPKRQHFHSEGKIWFSAFIFCFRIAQYINKCYSIGLWLKVVRIKETCSSTVGWYLEINASACFNLFQIHLVNFLVNFQSRDLSLVTSCLMMCAVSTFSSWMLLHF